MRTSTRFLMPVCAMALLIGCNDSSLAPRRIVGHDAMAARSGATFTTWPVSASQIAMSWPDNSKNELGWEVHRSTTGASGAFSLIASLPVDAVAYNDTGLEPLTQYCYKVRSFRASGQNTNYAAFTNVACSTTFGPPPAPSATRAVPRSSSIVDVFWTDNAQTEQEFRIERSSDPAGVWTIAGTASANQSTLTDNGRTEEKQVCYRVIAKNFFGESAPSSVGCTTPPAPPRDVAALSADGSSIDVTWTDASSVEDGYEVQRAASGNVFTTVANLTANVSRFHDGNVVAQTRYQYRVRATRDGGFSDFALPAVVELPTAPPVAPTNVSASPNGSTAVYVDWSHAPATVSGFRVQRSTDGQATWIDAGSVDGDVPIFREGGREPEQLVCYRVFAFNALGESGPSNTDCTAPPLNPVNMRAEQGNGVLLLTFTDRSNVEDYYLIVVRWCDHLCGIPREVYAYSEGGETSVVIYTEYDIEFVESVCAYSDGGCSDPGTWGPPAALSKINADAAGRSISGARPARVALPRTMLPPGKRTAIKKGSSGDLGTIPGCPPGSPRC